MKMKNALRKIFFISVPGIVIFFIALELSLTAGGYLYTKYYCMKEDASLESNTKDNFDILCLGDSFTYGLGAGPEDSYPAHLERKLNIKDSSLTYRVYNGGRIGSNSFSIVTRQLKESIPENIPDVVIVMTGCNNRWLLTDSSFFHLMGHRNKDFPGLMVAKIDNLLGDLKTYKLIKIAIFRFRYRKMNKIVESGAINVSLRQLNQEEKIKYKDDINVELAGYFINEEYDLAKTEIKEAMRHPEFVRSVFNIGTAVNCMKWACREDKIFFEEIDNVKKIVEEVYDEATYKEVKEIIDTLAQFATNMDIPVKILRSDLIETHRIAMNYGIDLILMTYPCGMGVVDDTIRRLSKELDIVLVDNQKIFEERLKIEQKEELFIDDGHCNAKGYELIAKNICDVLDFLL